MTLLRTSILAATTCALSLACSSAERLPPNYAPTQAAISAADAVGARQEPRAALHLKMARDQLVAAQTLAQRGKDDEKSGGPTRSAVKG